MSKDQEKPNLQIKVPKSPLSKVTKIQERRKNLSLLAGHFIELQSSTNIKLQKKAFQIWVQTNLSDSCGDFRSVIHGFEDGACLINLLQNLSGQNMRNFITNPTSKEDKLSNVKIALQFGKKLGLPLHISPNDIIEHKENNILLMVWEIAMFFRMREIPYGDFQPEEILLPWCQMCSEPFGLEVYDLTDGLLDGKIFCAIIAFHKPDLIQKSIFESQQKNETFKEVSRACEILRIPFIMDIEDLEKGKIDKKVTLVFLADLYHKFITESELEKLGEYIEEYQNNQILPDEMQQKVAIPLSLNLKSFLTKHPTTLKKSERKLQEKVKEIEKKHEEKIMELFNELKASEKQVNQLRDELERLKQPKQMKNEAKIETQEEKEKKEEIERQKNEIIAKNKEKISQLTKEIEDLDEQSRGESFQYALQIEDMETSAKKLEEEIEEIEKKQTKEIEELKEIAANEQKQLEAQVEELKTQAEKLEKELEEQPEPVEMEDDELDQLRHNREELERQMQDLELKMQSTQESMEDYKESRQELEEQIEESEKKNLGEKNTMENYLQEIREEIEQSKVEIMQEESREQELKHTLAKKDEELEVLKKQLEDKLENERSNEKEGKLFLFIQNLEKKIQESESRLKQFENLHMKKELQNQILNKKKNQIEQLIQKNAEFKSFTELNKKIYEEESLKLQEENERLKKQLVHQREKFEKELSQKSEEIKQYTRLNIEKEERQQVLEEEISETKSKIISQKKILDSNLEKLEEKLKEERTKFEQLQKDNVALTRNLEDVIANYNFDLESLKEVVDDTKTLIESKKKKSKQDKLLLESIDLISIKLEYEKQKSQAQQLHTDYDSLSRMLNAKIETISSHRKQIARIEENKKIKLHDLTQLENKYDILNENYQSLLRSSQTNSKSDDKEKEQLLAQLNQYEEVIQKTSRQLMFLQLREKGKNSPQDSIETSEKDQSIIFDMNIANQLIEKLRKSLERSQSKLKKVEQEKEQVDRELQISQIELKRLEEMKIKTQKLHQQNQLLVIELERLDSLMF